MRKLVAALFIFWLGFAAPAFAENAVGPTNRIFCNKSATLAAGPAAITQLVAGASGQTINVCGWSVTNTGATGTFSFQNGTGSNCGTGTATWLPALNITSTAPSTDHVSDAWISLPVGNALCITPSVATISAIVYYSTTP